MSPEHRDPALDPNVIMVRSGESKSPWGRASWHRKCVWTKIRASLLPHYSCNDEKWEDESQPSVISVDAAMGMRLMSRTQACPRVWVQFFHYVSDGEWSNIMPCFIMIQIWPSEKQVVEMLSSLEWQGRSLRLIWSNDWKFDHVTYSIINKFVKL